MPMTLSVYAMGTHVPATGPAPSCHTWGDTERMTLVGLLVCSLSFCFVSPSSCSFTNHWVYFSCVWEGCCGLLSSYIPLFWPEGTKDLWGLTLSDMCFLRIVFPFRTCPHHNITWPLLATQASLIVLSGLQQPLPHPQPVSQNCFQNSNYLKQTCLGKVASYSSDNSATP